MAKAKKSTEVEIPEGLNSFDRVQKEIEGKYGEGIIVSARSIIDQYEEVISVSPALDQILSGGVPKGSWLSVSGPPKTGKEQPVWAKVFTPDGPVRIDELRPGDTVCTPGGGTAKVTGVFPQGIKPVYKVTFQGGDTAYCGDEHLWEVQSRYMARPMVMALADFRDCLYEGTGNRPKWLVRIPHPVSFKAQEVSLDPYLLGLLIGDGGLTGGGVRFTTADHELCGAVTNALPEGHSLVLAGRVSKIDYYVRGTSGNLVSAWLRALGLKGRSSREKFIPRCYLYNTVEVRQALLQGLMDTDGTIDRRGHCSYSTTSERLAEDFKTLVQSLGHLCRVRRKRSYFRGKVCDSYVCLVRSNDTAKFFRLGRKKDRAKKRTKRPLTRKIVAVERSIDCECVCISIDSPDGLYLTDNFVVTHNTSMLMTLASNFQAYHRGKPRGGRVHYFNVEHRAKKKNIVGIAGLDQSEDRFKVYQSNLSRELAAEQFLEIAITVLKNDPECMVIFDSLSALVEADALTEGLGAETRGKGAKLVTRFVNNTQSTVPVMRSIVCGVNHLIADTGGGRGRIEKTSNRWLYQADIRLKLAWSESWDVGPREIGKKVHWDCQESALGPPGMSCIGYLRYGIGMDRVYETLELARAAPGLLTTSGNWLEFTFLNEHLGEGKVPKVNGMEKAYRLLTSNPAWVDHLQGKVNSFLRTPHGEGEGEE